MRPAGCTLYITSSDVDSSCSRWHWLSNDLNPDFQRPVGASATRFFYVSALSRDEQLCTTRRQSLSNSQVRQVLCPGLTFIGLCFTWA